MGLLSVLSVLVAQTLIVWILINNQKQAIAQQLKSTATTLMSLGISDYHGLQGFQDLDAFIEKSLRLGRINKIINVFTKRGKLMFSSHPAAEKTFSKIFKPSDKPAFEFFQTKRRKYHLLTSPYQAKNGKYYYLQLAIPYPHFRDIVASTIEKGLLLFILLAIITFFIAYYLAKKIAQPVHEIAAHVRRLDPKELKNWQPLALSAAGHYLNDITKGINDLTIRVKSTLYSLSKTNRYLVHEIRNPLTILTGEAETILNKKNADSKEYRAVLTSSLEEIERIEQVISSVSRISRVEGALFNPKPSNLTSWLDEEILRWRKSLSQELVWQRPSKDIFCLVDDELLHRLVDNLIRNIKDHTPPASKAFIFLTEEKSGVQITIEDTGPGLSEAVLKAVNEKRLEDERLGIGLGLCLEIASVCGFELFFTSKPEGGLRIHIEVG